MDFDTDILQAREAVEKTPSDDPDHPRLLYNLGVSLGDRYSAYGSIPDLEESIRVTQEAVKSTPLSHPNLAGRLSSLGSSIHEQYRRNGKFTDLEEAIRLTQEAVKATPSDHPNWAGRLNGHMVCLHSRYSRTGEMADLDQVIRLARQLVMESSLDSPNRAGLLNNLAVFLGDKYIDTGVTATLSEAIDTFQQAINATPLDDPDRASWLNNLTSYLVQRFSSTGEMSDIDEAIRISRKNIKNARKDDPQLPGWLENLGAYLGIRYVRTGSIADLEESIQLEKQAISMIPRTDSCWAKWSHNLAVRLSDRYSRTGRMADLEEAICVAREAVDVTEPDDRALPARLNNLGIYLLNRYYRTRQVMDLEDAIRITRKAIDATPPEDLRLADWRSSLGNCLSDRYMHMGDNEDIDEAIRVTQESIDGTAPDHPDRAGRFNNLGAHLGKRYVQQGAMVDLEQAIHMTRKAIDAMPPDHPDRAELLSNVGEYLGKRYTHTRGRADLEESQAALIEALNLPASIVSARVHAGRSLLSSPAILDNPPQASTIAKTAMSLMPLLTPRSLQNTDKRHLLSAAVGIASDAAAIALQNNEGPLTAIECLEIGRSVIAEGVFEQHDVSNLERNHPELAASFKDLRDRLDAPSLPGLSELTGVSAETEASWRRDMHQEFTEILNVIRSVGGEFSRFLLPSSEPDILDAAKSGPIIVLNVSPHRCDALMIEPSGIRLLELPRLSPEAIDARVHNLGSLETLEWLWDEIVGPVLTAPGFTSSTTISSQLPRVWWVPTGKLTKFPLHAAGYHLTRTGETALDRVVSSYASCVKSLIRVRQRGRRQQQHSIIAIAMEKTDGQNSLQHASEEVNTVLAVLGSNGMTQRRPLPRKSEVLATFQEACEIFHSAGHGQTHATEPLQSSLLLSDWREAPLTVASLMETDLGSRPPFLAYLSACGTSQVQEEGSLDESIHLANGCQLAGFRHVIGTLWSVNDGFCVDMARLTYEALSREGMQDESVGRGLHYATQRLRDRWVDSEDGREYEKQRQTRAGRSARLIEGEKMKRPLWVPYVHFGS
ncbi:hypothetical protein PT974_01525 [Cladobotryum mycophilum]|uniref:CHAT domain-containing protein n=1 Tax=Cladobotryum mycophilum TaxID=491253 RepID=A0ABR0T5B9_9HYPO